MKHDENSVDQAIVSEENTSGKFSYFIIIAPMELTGNEPVEGGRRFRERREPPEDVK
jgi:hypothetical protein